MRRWITWLLLAGFCLRALWLIADLAAPVPGEAQAVAEALAAGQGFSNPYLGPTGPTAHLLPLPVLIAGGAYAALGVSPGAAAMLGLWSIVLALASYVLFGLAFRRLGASRAAVTLGIAALALLPLYIEGEVVLFRVWEGSLGAFLGGLSLYLIATKRILLAGLASSLTFFVLPQLGLGAFAALALSASWKQLGISALILVAVLTPWTARNAIVMGEPISLRSNMGLELAISFYGGERDLWKRIDEIHPRKPEGFRRLQEAGGEVAYFKRLQAETLHWIGNNPVQSSRIALTNLAGFLFPSPEQWGGASGWQVRMAAHWAVTIFGLMGAAFAVWQRKRLYLASVMLGVTILPYALVFPVLRYRYPVLALLTLFSAFALVSIFRRGFQRG